jgi:hypothetical protein
MVELACLHDDVLHRIAADGPVLPMRFGTLCADTARLAALLRRSEASLCSALEEVRGRAEWTVRVTETRDVPSVATESGPRDGSGTDYLLGRRRAHDERAARTTARDTAVTDLDVRLGALVDRSASVRTADAFWTRAYLVRHQCAAQLTDELGRAREVLATVGLELHVDGPLPPYSFASVRLEAGS